MTESPHPRGRYFEQFEVGEMMETPARTITEADVVAFAGLSGDYNPIHTNAEFAKETVFGERVDALLLGDARAGERRELPVEIRSRDRRGFERDATRRLDGDGQLGRTAHPVFEAARGERLVRQQADLDRR